LLLGWPFLQEGSVHAISDESFMYTLSNGIISKCRHRPDLIDGWRRKADKCEQHYSRRYGTVTGTVNVIAHVLMLKGI